jgi:hypothetical protein
MIVGLIRTLLFFALVYYTVKFITWIYTIYKGVKNNSFQSNMREKEFRKKEGEINIDYIPKSKKVVDKDSGDYVDFEEVDK